METAVVVDGRVEKSVAVSDRGFSYGHGVFETMRLAGGSLPLWEFHNARLQVGLGVLNIPSPVVLIQQSLELLLEHVPKDGVVKLVVTAGSGGRGYGVNNTLVPTVVAQWSPLSAPTPGAVKLQRCNYRLPINPVLAGIKHLNRLDQVIAATELIHGNQGLLEDMEGNVIEGLSHNIFVLLADRWITPDLTQCGVAGVMRSVLLDEVFPSLQLQPSIEKLSIQSVIGAQEVFICNSIHGVQKVSGICREQGYDSFGQTDLVKARLARMYPCFDV